jgi:UMF1 family MFS transporter
MLKKGHKRLLNAWAFYDWANSVYTLTVTSSIFPIFYSAVLLKSKPKALIVLISDKNNSE